MNEKPFYKKFKLNVMFWGIVSEIICTLLCIKFPEYSNFIQDLMLYIAGGAIAIITGHTITDSKKAVQDVRNASNPPSPNPVIEDKTRKRR